MGKKIWLSSMHPGNFGSEKIVIVSPSVRPSLHVSGWEMSHLLVSKQSGTRLHPVFEF